MEQVKAQEDIIYQLRSIASLTTELKKVFYASNSKKWNDVYQKLKVSLDVLVQDAMNMDLYFVVESAEWIRNMMEGLKGRRAGRGGRGRKKKSSISVRSICKSITELINGTIEELKMNYFESSSDDQNLRDYFEHAIFQEEYNDLVPIEYINENQVLEL